MEEGDTATLFLDTEETIPSQVLVPSLVLFFNQRLRVLVSKVPEIESWLVGIMQFELLNRGNYALRLAEHLNTDAGRGLKKSDALRYGRFVIRTHYDTTKAKAPVTVDGQGSKLPFFPLYTEGGVLLEAWEDGVNPFLYKRYAPLFPSSVSSRGGARTSYGGISDAYQHRSNGSGQVKKTINLREDQDQNQDHDRDQDAEAHQQRAFQAFCDAMPSRVFSIEYFSGGDIQSSSNSSELSAVRSKRLSKQSATSENASHLGGQTPEELLTLTLTLIARRWANTRGAPNPNPNPNCT